MLHWAQNSSPQSVSHAQRWKKPAIRANTTAEDIGECDEANLGDSWVVARFVRLRRRSSAFESWGKVRRWQLCDADESIGVLLGVAKEPLHTRRERESQHDRMRQCKRATKLKAARPRVLSEANAVRFAIKVGVEA